MPNKNTERHISGMGMLIDIFEKRKVRWERKRGGKRRRMRKEEGSGEGGPSSSSSYSATHSHCGMSKQNSLLKV